MSIKVKCVHCGELAHEFAVECPKCGKPVANKDAPTNMTELSFKRGAANKKKSPVIPVIIAIALIAVIALIYILK